jgi:EF hand
VTARLTVSVPDTLLVCCSQHWYTEGDIDRVMNLYDVDHSGDISLDEFGKLASTQQNACSIMLLFGNWQIFNSHAWMHVQEKA